MKKFISIILARGGSKGIPSKNITEFCGKPLLAWTIEQCLEAGIERVFVSSDSQQILDLASAYQGIPLLRPSEISGDQSTSEEGWVDAVRQICELGEDYEWIVAPQVTSPLRTATDFKNGMMKANTGEYDSLFSCSPVDDLCLWVQDKNGVDSISYDWKCRKRRQDNSTQFIENGSFYIFKPDNLVKYKNRLSGKIGLVEMEFWKMFEIDDQNDLFLCSKIMDGYLLKN